MLIRTKPTPAQIAADRQADLRRALAGDDVYWKGTYTQSLSHFRIRADTDALSSTTWAYAEDTNGTRPLDTNFRVRICKQETGGASSGGIIFINTLYFRRNGGAIAQVTASTSFLRYSLSSQFAHGDTFTQQLSGTGTMIASAGLETATNVEVADFTANNHVEIEACLTIRSADGAVNGDVFELFNSSGGLTNLVTPTITVAAAVFTPSQAAYQFAEDGTESGATLIGTLNTALSRDVTSDSNLQLRIRIQEGGATSGATTDDYQLQRSINAGAFANVTSTSTGAKSNTGSALTDGGTTTNRLGAGSGSFVAGEQEEANGLVEDRQLTASNFTEHVWALTLVAADLANADALTFRVLVNGATMTYSQTPTINVTKTSAATSFIFPSRTPAMSSLLVR